MKNEIKKWFSASVFTSIGIALGMLMGGSKKNTKNCKNATGKEQPIRQKITVH